MDNNLKKAPLFLFYETGLCTRCLRPDKGRVVGFRIGEDIFSFDFSTSSYEDAEKISKELLDFNRDNYFAAVVPSENQIKKLQENLELINRCIEMFPPENEFRPWKNLSVWSNKRAASDYRFVFNLETGKSKSLFVLKEAHVVWCLKDTGKPIDRG